MTTEEAIQTAAEYTKVRYEVRRHLLALAREKNPAPAGCEPRRYGRWPQGASSTLRKLYQWPTDLSDARLLALATGQPEGGDER